ncbi:MAG: hypothetical protein P4L51_23925 [Puia sp.]|nr:hypothetical protein [Puia sp.]
MKKHLQNLFRLTNLHELDFSYKLVKTDLKWTPDKEDLFNKHIRKVGERVASLTQGPVAVVKRNGGWYIAIPQNRELPEMRVDVGPIIVTVVGLSEVYRIDPHQVLQASNRSLVMNFLDFEIRKQLGANKGIWKLTNTHFLYRKPLQSNEDSSIEVYGGFSYRLVWWDGAMYVCLNLTTRYIDKHYLSHYINEQNVDILEKKLFGRRVVYQNGDDWYAAEFKGFGNPLREHFFTYDGVETNVFEFIVNKTQRHRFPAHKLLKDHHLAFLYTYPGRSMEPHSGATSIAKLILSTQDKQVSALHKFSIKDPARRFDGIVSSIQTFFQGLSFNAQRLIIEKRPAEELIRSFPMPALKYKNDQILKPGHYSKGGNVDKREYGKERKQFLQDNGILTETEFDEQWLIVPDYMVKEQVEAFKKNAEYQLKKLAPRFKEFRIVRFKAIEGLSATYQVQEIEKALRQANALSGFALFVIPDQGRDAKRLATTFHDCLKSKFYPNLKVQCASASKIMHFFQPFESSLNREVIEYRVPEELKPRFRTYLFNLDMEHLIMNRKWPYALAKDLHYDVYVGIDVHGRYAGFTFFFKNGENIFFIPLQVPKKTSGSRAEKLKADFLFGMIYEKLKIYIPRYASDPNGIVILRDGRSFSEDQKALEQVVEQLAGDGIVDQKRIKYGVVDLYKQSAVPFRVALLTDNYDRIDNPEAGVYKVVNNSEGFLFNTGYPFALRGTAKPQHLCLASGNVDFLKVMEDVFCQSMLAYSAPDRSNSLPVTIKLIDTLLKPLTATADILEEDEEELDETLID